ncbi:MAG: ribosome maturation factor RimM, partial [Lachnospiraceae bacterium]|nr:ribosome maturation factor RimM [Lachnospiraceae bacterium]
MDDLLRVGVISSTHGVRGEVKVYPTTDNPERFKALAEVLVDIGGKTEPLAIENVHFFKNMVILKLEGIDDMDTAAKYKGRDLWVTRENAVPLEEGEFFICDVIGSTVFEEDGKEFGTLK